jgi:hypothetical protein
MVARSGTLAICVQNLDFSGANQLVLNVVRGKVHQCNVVVLSPRVGTFAARYVDTGAAVRTGDISALLNDIPDVFVVLCNTILTAHIVLEVSRRPHCPCVWVLHEWWPEELLAENLRMRGIEGLTLATIQQALKEASQVVFVCEAQVSHPRTRVTFLF